MNRRQRRTFSAAFKFETVLEAMRGEKSAAQICRERDINENLLSRWQQEFLQHGPELFERQGSNGRGVQEHAEGRIAELERLVGRQAMEIEVLKKAGSSLRLAWSKSGR
jgi:transposase-like protein